MLTTTGSVKWRPPVDDRISGSLAKNCLIARRLVERGVRFVQVFTGGAGADDWDAAHADSDRVHKEMTRRTDRPVAGLLQDLKARGLLESTLIVWGGEFGRAPITDGRFPDKPAGRDHTRTDLQHGSRAAESKAGK